MTPDLLVNCLRRTVLGRCLKGMTDAEALSKAHYWFEEWEKQDKAAQEHDMETFLAISKPWSDPDGFAVGVVNAMPHDLRKVLKLSLEEQKKVDGICDALLHNYQGRVQ